MPTSWPRPATDPFTSSASPPAACTWSSPWSRRSTGPAACSTSSSARPGSATTGSATSWLPPDPAEPKPDRRGLARAPVHERRLDDRRLPATAADVEFDLLADLDDIAGPHVRHRDPGPEDRRVGPARDLADELVVLEHGIVRSRDVAPLMHAEPSQQARQPLLLLAEQRRAPAELALVEGDRPPQPGFEGGRRLEEILPVERVAHLQPEDVAGRQPSWRTPGRPNRVEQVAPEIGGDVLVREELEAHLAGVAGACHDHRPAVVLGLDAAHERQPAGRREESRYHVRRHRPLHGQEAPVLVVDQVQR